MADPQKVLVELPDGRRGAIPRGSVEAAVARGARIVQDEPPQPTPQPTQQPMQASMSGEAAPGVFSNALEATGKFMRSAGDVVNPAPVLDALSGSGQFRGKNPLQAVGQVGNSMLEAQADQLTKARDAWGQGNYTDALRYGMGYLIPMLGPGVNHAGDLIAQGRVAEGLGETAGLGLSVMAPAKMQQAGHVSVRPLIRPALNQAEAAAIAFADASGIPVDLAMRSGSKWVQHAKTLLQGSMTGGLISRTEQQKQTAAIGSAAQQQADEVYPRPITAQQAGEGVQNAVPERARQMSNEAGHHYGNLREIESRPENLRTVQVGMAKSPEAALELDAFAKSQTDKPFSKLTKEQQASVYKLAQLSGVQLADQPVMETMAVPVDVRNLKELAGGPLEDLKQLYKSADPETAKMRGQEQAMLQSIVDGPDFKSASIADRDLSAMKAASRLDDGQIVRNEKQGMAARTVQELYDQVERSVAEAGPEALEALQSGREAFKSQKSAEAVANKLLKEPVQVFQQLTYQGDSGVAFLKRVAAEVPSEIPKVGRAFLQGLFEDAMRTGEFTGGKSLTKRWEALGPETKAVLVPNPRQRQDISNLFQLAEMQSRDPNPSGTAKVASLVSQGAALLDPKTAAFVLIAPPILAKLMYSPKATRLLTQAFKIPIGNRAAATMAFQGLMAEIAKVDRDQERERKAQ